MTMSEQNCYMTHRGLVPCCMLIDFGVWNEGKPPVDTDQKKMRLMELLRSLRAKFCLR